MVKIQNSAIKKIRISLIVFFIIQTLLTTQPFLRGLDENGELVYYSALKMISFIGYNDQTTRMGLVFIAFLVLPLIALGFQIFDFYYNLKNAVGFIVSALGVIGIVFFIGPSMMGSGSLISLLVYILTAFLSIMGMLARIAKTGPDKTDKK